MTSRTPGESVAHGFSQNTCLFAFTAAVRCCGRKPGGVASITTSTLLITFSKASSPTYARSILTWLPNRSLPFKRLVAWSTIVSSTSATEVRTLFLSAVRAWPAAPLPRPPQPTRPSFSELVTDCPEMIPGNPVAMTPATVPVFLRKSRRSIFCGFLSSVMDDLPVAFAHPSIPHHTVTHVSVKAAARKLHNQHHDPALPVPGRRIQSVDVPPAANVGRVAAVVRRQDAE